MFLSHRPRRLPSPSNRWPPTESHGAWASASSSPCRAAPSLWGGRQTRPGFCVCLWGRLWTACPWSWKPWRCSDPSSHNNDVMKELPSDDVTKAPPTNFITKEPPPNGMIIMEVANDAINKGPPAMMSSQGRCCHKGGYQWPCEKSVPEWCHKGAADNVLNKDDNYWTIKSLPHCFFFIENLYMHLSLLKVTNLLVNRTDIQRIWWCWYSSHEVCLCDAIEMCIVTSEEIKVLFLS